MSDASGPVGRRIDAEELLAHAAWLRALARSLVGDEHAADDVVQETFAAAVEHPPRESGALRGWLAKVARNAAWKSIRGRRRREVREQSAARGESAPSADELVARIELQRALLDAVQELETPYRTVVMLRFYDGKAPRDIARELGVTPEVVWQRLSRATSTLRARLDGRRGGRDEWKAVAVLWLGGRSAAKWTGGAAAAAAGTGAVVMGTKTVVALTAAAALAAWLVWPRDGGASKETASPKPVVATNAVPPAPHQPAQRTPRVVAAEADTTVATATPPRARTRGRVVDADTGAPISGARVQVDRKSAGGGFRWALVTGDDGTFSGDVSETARYSDEYAWSAISADVYVAASARGYVHFYEAPWSGPKGEDLGDLKLVRGVIVRGRVVHDDGRAAPGASVYATAGPERVGEDEPLNRARPLGKADDQGRFELDEALQPTRAGDVFTLLAACSDGVAFTTLPVRKGRDVIDDVVLTLRGAAMAVRVLDADDRPLAGAVVTAYPRFGAMGVLRGDPVAYSIAGDELLRSLFVKTTGADGLVRFTGMPLDARASAYDFAAASAGYVTGWARSFLQSSITDAVVDVKLVRDQKFVVGARVVDADGRPVEGALVTPLHSQIEPVTTGADGVFVLRRGEGEQFGRDASVEITKDGFAKCSETVWRWPDDGRKLGEIRLLRPAPVSGRVVDQDGRAVLGAIAYLQRPEKWVKASGDGKTDAEGRFSFADATEGEWALIVQPFGGGTWVVPPPQLVRGGDADVVVRMERLPEGRATLTVTVVDAESGAPVDADAAMLVDAGPSTGRQIMGALPQPKIEHGRITVERVAPGARCLWVRVADRPHQLVRVRIAEGETDVRATCRVRRGSVVTGRVRLPAGVAASRVGLEYALADGQLSAGGPGWGPVTAAGWVNASADGTFRIEGITPAAYRITAHLDGWMGDVVVDASEGDAEGVIELTRGALVKVPVPAFVANVTCMRIETSLDGAPWTTLVNAGLAPDRPFTITNTLPPGKLRWRAVFHATPSAADVVATAEPQEGEVVLEAGKEVEIAVPVVPRK